MRIPPQRVPQVPHPTGSSRAPVLGRRRIRCADTAGMAVAPCLTARARHHDDEVVAAGHWRGHVSGMQDVGGPYRS